MKLCLKREINLKITYRYCLLDDSSVINTCNNVQANIYENHTLYYKMFTQNKEKYPTINLGYQYTYK